MPLWLGDQIEDEPGAITDYPATMGQAAYAAGRRAYDSGGVVYGAYNALVGQMDWEAGRRVSKEDALKRVGQLGLSIDVPEEGISQYKLDTQIWYKAREMVDQAYIQRGPSGVGATVSQFGTSILGSLGDPLALAANFVPIVSQAKWFNALKGAGGHLGRAGVRAKYGAVEGLVGATAIEPLIFAHNKWSQLDYTVMDSFVNIAFGGVTGAGLHSLGGFAVDKFTGFTPARIRDIAPKMGEDAALKVFEEHVRAAEEGRPARDAMKMFMEELRSSYEGWRSTKASGLTDVELASRALELDLGSLRRAAQDVKAARFPDAEQETGMSLFAQIALEGGIKVRDAEGNITKEGAEVLALVRDSKYPGLINNVRGAPPDYVRERMAEDGWFGDGRNVGEVDIQEFYDLLDAGARGQVVHPHYRGALAENRAHKSYVAAVTRELTEADIPAHLSETQAAEKLARFRAEKMRQRALDDIDFDPEEFLFRDPGDAPGDDAWGARFGDDDSTPYSFGEEERQAARDAAEAEVEVYRATDEEEALQEDISRLDRIVQSMKARDMWTKADDELLKAAQADRELASFFESVYKAAAVCELQ